MYIHQQHNDERVWLTDDDEDVESIIQQYGDHRHFAHHEIDLKGEPFHLFVISDVIDVTDKEKCIALARAAVMDIFTIF